MPYGRSVPPSALIREATSCSGWKLTPRSITGQCAASKRLWRTQSFQTLPIKAQGSTWKGRKKILRARGDGWLPGNGVFRATGRLHIWTQRLATHKAYTLSSQMRSRAQDVTPNQEVFCNWYPVISFQFSQWGTHTKLSGIFCGCFVWFCWGFLFVWGMFCSSLSFPFFF